MTCFSTDYYYCVQKFTLPSGSREHLEEKKLSQGRAEASLNSWEQS